MAKTLAQDIEECGRAINEAREIAKWRAISAQAREEAQLKETAAAAAHPEFEYTDTWTFPTVEGNLTYHNSWGNEAVEDYMTSIVDVMTRFNLDFQFANVKQGATFTRFYLTPLGHTKVQSVLRLENDFKAALNNGSLVRFDEGCIVIEVPRKNRSTVYLGDLVRSGEFKKSGNTALAIGMDIDLHPVICDLKKAVHILIAGQTGSGKSVFMRTLMLSMLMKNTPWSLHMHCVDLKRVEFMRYRNHPLCTVVTETDDAQRLLDGMCKEMERRYQVLAESGNRDIDSYNAAHADAPMRREVVIIDELGDLMEQAGATVETYIVRLAQKARACGIHLILATQYPVRKVVTGLIKQNMPTRICLSVKDAIASRVALDVSGAEDLLGNGDLLYLANGAMSPVRLQGGFVDEVGIANIINAVTQNIVRVKNPNEQEQAPAVAQPSVCFAQRQNYTMPFASYSYDAPQAPAKKVRQRKVYVLGIASLMCGFLGLLFWMIFIPALMGIAFGINGMRDNMECQPLAALGTVVSSVALLIPFMVFVF